MTFVSASAEATKECRKRSAAQLTHCGHSRGWRRKKIVSTAWCLFLLHSTFTTWNFEFNQRTFFAPIKSIYWKACGSRTVSGFSCAHNADVRRVFSLRCKRLFSGEWAVFGGGVGFLLLLFFAAKLSQCFWMRIFQGTFVKLNLELQRRSTEFAVTPPDGNHAIVSFSVLEKEYVEPRVLASSFDFSRRTFRTTKNVFIAKILVFTFSLKASKSPHNVKMTQRTILVLIISVFVMWCTFCTEGKCACMKNQCLTILGEG